MSDLNLHHLLASLSTNVKTELASTPDVLDKGHDLDIDTLPIEARRWHRANTHDPRVDTGHAPRYQATDRSEAAALGELLRRDHDRRPEAAVPG